MNYFYELLTKYDALQHGHFQLSSGLHSNVYVQCAKVLQYPWVAEKLAKAMTYNLSSAQLGQKVLGAAHGGTVLSYAVADACRRPSLFAERVNGKLELRRGFEIKPGEKILIVEDVVTTGETVFELMHLVADHCADTIAVVSIIDRSQNQPGFHVPFTSLLKLDPILWTPDQCLLCQKGEPITKPGSRAIV